jgi:MFS family permease
MNDKGANNAPEPLPNTARAVWLANMTGFVNQLAVSMAHFLTPLYALELGASPGIVGLIASASSIAGFVIALPAGKAIDRLGAKKAVSYATLCKTVSVLIFLVTSAPVALIAPMFLIGVFGTVAILGFHSYVSGLAHGTQRAKGISDFALFSSLAELAGPVGAGSLADLVGFKATFTCTAIFCGLTLIPLWYLPAAAQARAEEKPTPLRGFRGLLVYRGVQVVLLGSGSFAMLRSFHRAFLPVLLYDAYSATEIASLFAVTTVASVVGRSAVRWTAKLWSVENALALSIVANAVPLMLMPTTLSYLPLAAMMAVFGVSNGFLGVVTVVHTADTVAAPERGLAFGMRTTLMRFGSFTGQLAFGSFAEITSIGLSFFGMGLIGIVGAIVLLRLTVRQSLAAKSEKK